MHNKYSSNMGNCNSIKNYCYVEAQNVSNNCNNIPQPNCNCNCNCNMNCSKCSDCAKYKDIANKKCEQATFLSNEAEQVSNKASQIEEQAKILACEANELWKKYECLSDESMALMEDAKRALEMAIQCYKNCHRESGYKPNLDCNFNNSCSHINDGCSCNCNIKPQPKY